MSATHDHLAAREATVAVPVTFDGELTIAHSKRAAFVGFAEVGGDGKRIKLVLPLAEACLLANAILESVRAPSAGADR